MEATQFVTVGVFASRPEAQVSRARLAAEGLEAIVAADDAGGYEPPLGLTNGVRLLVRARYAAFAIGVLDPPEAGTSRRPPVWVASVAALLSGLILALVGLPVIVTVLKVFA